MGEHCVKRITFTPLCVHSVGLFREAFYLNNGVLVCGQRPFTASGVIGRRWKGKLPTYRQRRHDKELVVYLSTFACGRVEERKEEAEAKKL